MVYKDAFLGLTVFLYLTLGAIIITVTVHTGYCRFRRNRARRWANILTACKKGGKCGEKGVIGVSPPTTVV